MKKVFTFLFMALFAVGLVTATDVTFDYTSIYSSVSSNQAVTSDTSGDVTITYDKGTNNNSPKYYSNGAAIRIYGGNTFTIASTGNAIEKVVINRGNTTTNAITASAGTFEDNASGSNTTYTDVEWTGSETSITFTIGGTSGQARLKKIVVTLADGEVAVKAPVISPAGGSFVGSQEVSISCETEGASIYYTTDGTDPTASSTAYTAPFTLTESATVKAIAIKGSDQSSIASATFTAIPSVSTIKEGEALESGTNFAFTGEVTVTYVNGSYTFIKDDSGSGLIYGSLSQTYEQGQVIPAGWTGTYTLYKNLPEFKDVSNLSASTKTATVEPTTYSPSDISTDKLNEYVMVENCTMNEGFTTITYTDSEGNSSTLTVYNRFDITLPTYSADSTYNILGVVSIYNSTLQVMPIEITTYKAEEQELIRGNFVIKSLDGTNWNLSTGEEFQVLTQNDSVQIMQLPGFELPAVNGDMGYFAFTSALAPSDTAWNAIAEYRFGPAPTQNNNFNANEYIESSFDATSDNGYDINELNDDCIINLGLNQSFVELTAGTYDIYLIYKSASETVTYAVGEDSWAKLYIVNPNSTGVYEVPNMAAISSVKYYNLNGVESTQPMDGVNIRVTTYTDGTRHAVKALK